MKRAACVVAHPDDEVIWGAGFVLREPYEWDIICCSIPAYDAERIKCFHVSCSILGGNPIVLQESERAKGRTAELSFPGLDLSPYEFIVTHNARGEYGHPQHQMVHRRALREDAEIMCFGYGMPRTDHRIELTAEEFADRVEALRCYNYKYKADENHLKADWLVKTYYGSDWGALAKETYVNG